MSDAPTPPRLTVYFDGSCPLCRREIAMYRRLPAADALCWVDVSTAQALGEGLSCEAAMRRFHVRDAQGRLFSGGAAFARLWRCLPGWRLLGVCFSWPPLSAVLELAYRAFLPLRPGLQRLVQRWAGTSSAGAGAACHVSPGLDSRGDSRADSGASS